MYSMRFSFYPLSSLSYSLHPLWSRFFFNISIFIFFYFTILYWFCHTSAWIRHGCTHVPHPEPPSHLPPHTIPLGQDFLKLWVILPLLFFSLVNIQLTYKTYIYLKCTICCFICAYSWNQHYHQDKAHPYSLLWACFSPIPCPWATAILVTINLFAFSGISCKWNSSLCTLSCLAVHSAQLDWDSCGCLYY